MAQSKGPAVDDPTLDGDEDDDLEQSGRGVGGGNCLVISTGALLSGGVLGGIFGFGGGLFKRQGFKFALQEGSKSAKTFAVLSGVHSLVTCTMQRLRNTEDVINQGVAGCASGIALGWGGPPATMLQNCAGFAAFAFIYEMLSARSAVAGQLTSSHARTRARRSRGAACQRSTPGLSLGTFRLPSLCLALPCWLNQDVGCHISGDSITRR